MCEKPKVGSVSVKKIWFGILKTEQNQQNFRTNWQEPYCGLLGQLHNNPANQQEPASLSEA